MGLSGREQELCRRIRAAEDRLLDDLRRMVEIPTGTGYEPGLDECRAYMTGRLGALGADVSLIPGARKEDWLSSRDRASVRVPPTALCRRLERGGACRVLLSGHLDTVHDPCGPFRSLVVNADGQRATGPGCADMKGGLVVALGALETIESMGIPISWGFVLNSDEETGSFHSDATLRTEAAAYDVGLAFEPAMSDGGLVVERPGSGQFLIEVTGRPAHVGRDFASGASAIVGLAECIRSVHALVNPADSVIVNVGIIEGGTATNVVPEHARAWGNVRFPSGETGESLGRRLDALSSEGVTVRVRRAFNRPAKPSTPAVLALASMARRVSEDLGRPLPFGRTGGVCDGNNLQAAGLPTIDTLGVRGGGLHTPQEWIDLPSLVERAQLAGVLLLRLGEQGYPAAR